MLETRVNSPPDAPIRERRFWFREIWPELNCLGRDNWLAFPCGGSRGNAKAAGERYAPGAGLLIFSQSSIQAALENVAPPRCGLMPPMGKERANAISERESNNETDPDRNFEARCHNARNPGRAVWFQPSWRL
jgi:hypothetical protein